MTDQNQTEKEKEILIKVGDVFKTKSDNIFSGELIKIKSVENPTSKDGYGFFDTANLIHRKKYNHSCRIWWFLEMCYKVETAEQLIKESEGLNNLDIEENQIRTDRNLSKCFSVNSKDLFNKDKNPNLNLSVKDILNNDKIKKKPIKHFDDLKGGIKE